MKAKELPLLVSNAKHINDCHQCLVILLFLLGHSMQWVSDFLKQKLRKVARINDMVKNG